VDMKKEGVVEPLRVKTQAISGASEAAVMILRIDDVIAASKLAGKGAPPMGPGMGDMATWACKPLACIPPFSFIFTAIISN